MPTGIANRVVVVLVVAVVVDVPSPFDKSMACC